MTVYTSYHEDGRPKGGRPRTRSRRRIQPGQPAQPPPRFAYGETPILVGSAFPQTNYRLEVLGESGRPVRYLGNTDLQHPAPFQFRRQREKAGGTPPG